MTSTFITVGQTAIALAHIVSIGVVRSKFDAGKALVITTTTHETFSWEDDDGFDPLAEFGRLMAELSARDNARSVT